MRHLIDFGDLTREEWDSLYARASEIIDNPEKFHDVCRGKVAASLFYEPSTRTNFSFQTAMLRLGGTVFGFADPNSSSVAKGETLKDTVRMVSSYADVVVMRTPWEGGHAEVRAVMKITGAGIIAGSYVTDGKMQRNAQVRLLRDNVVVHEGKLSSLKHYKEDVKEMKEGFECGMSLEGHNDIKEGDIIECFIMEEIPR